MENLTRRGNQSLTKLTRKKEEKIRLIEKKKSKAIFNISQM